VTNYPAIKNPNREKGAFGRHVGLGTNAYAPEFINSIPVAAGAL
jgi:hypothetical protein